MGTDLQWKSSNAGCWKSSCVGLNVALLKSKLFPGEDKLKSHDDLQENLSGLALRHGYPQDLRAWGHGARWHHTGWDAWLSAGVTPSALSPDSVFPRGHHEWMRDVATSAPRREVSQRTDTHTGLRAPTAPTLRRARGHGDTEQCGGGTWGSRGWEGWRPPWRCTAPSLWLPGRSEPWKAVPIPACVPIHVSVHQYPIHVPIPANVCSSPRPAQLLCLHLPLPPPCPTWHGEVAVS